MLKTVQEAKRLWCPFSKADKDQDEECLADSCAAWRWDEGKVRPRVKVHLSFEHWIKKKPQMDLQEQEKYEEEFLSMFKSAPKRPEHVPSNYYFKLEPEDEEGPIALWIEPEEDAKARRQGYCGLAGRPDYE